MDNEWLERFSSIRRLVGVSIAGMLLTACPASSVPNAAPMPVEVKDAPSAPHSKLALLCRVHGREANPAIVVRAVNAAVRGIDPPLEEVLDLLEFGDGSRELPSVFAALRGTVQNPGAVLLLAAHESSSDPAPPSIEIGAEEYEQRLRDALGQFPVFIERGTPFVLTRLEREWWQMDVAPQVLRFRVSTSPDKILAWCREHAQPRTRSLQPEGSPIAVAKECVERLLADDRVLELGSSLCESLRFQILGQAIVMCEGALDELVGPQIEALPGRVPSLDDVYRCIEACEGARRLAWNPETEQVEVRR